MGEELLAIDLFMGAGGSSIGLRDAGFKVVGALDFDQVSCETYKRYFEFEPICDDLNKWSGERILTHFGLKDTTIDLLVGCPPCQGFSSLRRTRDPTQSDERRDLVEVFADRVKHIKPRSVIFENVTGMLGENNIKYFEQYLERMEVLGYKTRWDKVNAADYGVPQTRKRVIAISVKGLEEKPDFPEKTHSRTKIEGKERWVTVKKVIGGLPPLQPGEASSEIYNHVARNHTEKVLNLIRHIPKDGGSRRSLPDELWLDCHKKLKKEKGRGAENIYGRMAWDAPSNTMTCRCTTPSSGRFLHPEQDRAITVREAARLQTFPDDYVFPESMGTSERLIGNAVPPKLMKVFGKKVLEYL